MKTTFLETIKNEVIFEDPEEFVEYINYTFVCCKFKEAFSGYLFKGCTFENCDFCGAIFKGCDFQCCQFINCVKIGAQFLFETRFSRCIGIDWVSISFEGFGPNNRTLLWVEGIYHCGCFSGTEKELIDFIESNAQAFKPSRMLGLKAIKYIIKGRK